MNKLFCFIREGKLLQKKNNPFSFLTQLLQLLKTEKKIQLIFFFHWQTTASFDPVIHRRKFKQGWLFPSFVHHCCHIGETLHLPKYMQSEYYRCFTRLLLCKTTENAIIHVKRTEAAMLVLFPIFNRGAKCYSNLYSYLVKLVVKTETSSLHNIISAI